MKKRKQKRGFTMVEVTLSLVLVGLIMLSVFATISASISIGRKDKIKFHAVQEVDNLVNCYSLPDNGAVAPSDPFQDRYLGKLDAIRLYLQGELPEEAVNTTVEAVKAKNATFFYSASGKKLPSADGSTFKITALFVDTDGTGTPSAGYKPSSFYVFKAILTDGEDVIYEHKLYC